MAQVVVGKNEYVPKDQNVDYEGNDMGQVKQSVTFVLALHSRVCLCCGCWRTGAGAGAVL